jgi:putative transcription factor
VTYNLKIQLQQARQAKKWNQKQLATACSLPESVIRDYENGRAIPRSQDLIKMSRVLGVILKNR